MASGMFTRILCCINNVFLIRTEMVFLSVWASFGGGKFSMLDESKLKVGEFRFIFIMSYSIYNKNCMDKLFEDISICA